MIQDSAIGQSRGMESRFAASPLPRLAAIAWFLAVAACVRADSGSTIVRAPEASRCPVITSAMDGWNDPAPPRRVFGNTWYVGTCGITSILIATAQGHVLIDGATEEAAPLIKANIRALGFELKDVKYILSSHAHYDHVAGISELQRATGAKVIAREPAAAALQRGMGDRSDPQFLALPGFPPVSSVEPIADGGVVPVGSLLIASHATPGHTPGGTSWTWPSCERGRCVTMAYVDSLGAASDGEYRYADHSETMEAFRASIERVANLPCDVLITPHPLASDLFRRLDGRWGARLIDSSACRRLAESAREGFERRLAKEASDEL